MSHRSSGVSDEAHPAIAVPDTPTLTTRYILAGATSRICAPTSAGGTVDSALAPGPLPSAFTPWQTAQLRLKSDWPRARSTRRVGVSSAASLPRAAISR